MSTAKRVIPVPAHEAASRTAYRIGEVAYLLGATYDAVLRLVHSGDLAHKKVGQRLIIPRSEIDRFISTAVRAA